MVLTWWPIARFRITWRFASEAKREQVRNKARLLCSPGQETQFPDWLIPMLFPERVEQSPPS
jgi:hypothetical protein